MQRLLQLSYDSKAFSSFQSQPSCLILLIGLMLRAEQSEFPDRSIHHHSYDSSRIVDSQAQIFARSDLVLLLSPLETTVTREFPIAICSLQDNPREKSYKTGIFHVNENSAKKCQE